jgi:hypothetical protein
LTKLQADTGGEKAIIGKQWVSCRLTAGLWPVKLLTWDHLNDRMEKNDQSLIFEEPGKNSCENNRN